MSKKVLVILAEGFEEVEAITPIDVLRRAQVEVVVAGLDSERITGSRGVTVIADKVLDEDDIEFDALILHGGNPGAINLGNSGIVKELVKKMNGQGKIIAAICAAPAVVLGPIGVLNGKKATCFPGSEKGFPDSVEFCEDNVVIDGNIITSRGMGTSLEYSLAIVEKLIDKQTADRISKAVVWR
ncbi:MAG: DJ-1/PfpI family protein [Candidatus Omnitrophica bacterium]|nr:DJ-1/PfpI family protein [Candidatus Omnitrophota bacterium]MBU1996294.1 DJ-1/PfpI family protein [Candidatus Omnitrophota bacterium]MBU4333008.1 DJ-1/PfpI family protein [Candidatus Omnitrophota bacterium]